MQDAAACGAACLLPSHVSLSVPASVRSVHRIRDQSGAVQPTPLPDGQHTLPSRGGGQLPRQFPAVGRLLHPPA